MCLFNRFAGLSRHGGICRFVLSLSKGWPVAGTEFMFGYNEPYNDVRP
ncbi:hypothetical protein D3OALGA1CA_3130 [Olavius algarvensis associated proteobacterium Delta 3]|nr:hypothetical protein D3OALGA1CA_3130 [Olavius algarvensis associated proteobacterium Delta 3]